MAREGASSATAAARRTCCATTIEDGVSDGDFERERDAIDPPLRTREELAYHRIFAEHLPGVTPERTLGRFATT